MIYSRNKKTLCSKVCASGRTSITVLDWNTEMHAGSRSSWVMMVQANRIYRAPDFPFLFSQKNLKLNFVRFHEMRLSSFRSSPFCTKILSSLTLASLYEDLRLLNAAKTPLLFNRSIVWSYFKSGKRRGRVFRAPDVKSGSREFKSALTTKLELFCELVYRPEFNSSIGPACESATDLTPASWEPTMFIRQRNISFFQFKWHACELASCS